MIREELISKLTAPFKRSDLRFKKGGGGKWYPYFDVDAIVDRLNAATDNQWDFFIDDWHWSEKALVTYGHLLIPGLGKRGGIGIQEIQSAAGNDMGADMIKGSRADLLKNCAVLFGVGDQYRSMDALPFDPMLPANRERIVPYLDHYFPRPERTVTVTI